MAINEISASLDMNQVGVATMVLFAVIDIVGSIPIIIGIKEKAGEIHPMRATLVAMAIMVSFLFLGESILRIIHLDVQSFAVAGSFILFFMSLEMILGVTIFKDDETTTSKVASVVPLAFPIIAGAGTMTSLISMRAEFEMQNILVAIIINMVVVYVVLKLTKRIENALGKGGIAIIKKVFGIILLAIAVKLFTHNISDIFKMLE